MINSILKKYSGWTNYWYPDVKEPNVYVNSDVSKKYSEGCAEKELHLLNKWKKYIPQGWYGFSLGSPCPHDWYKIIDEFLDYLKELEEFSKIEDLEIHQIKIKYGGLRFYVSFSCKDDEFREHLELQIARLENHLHDDKLIY